MSIKIIIVDDDKVAVILHQLNITSSKLSSEPPIALEATEAISFLLKNQKVGDKYLVFLDLNMPSMNGWEFLEKINSYPVSDDVFTVIVTSSINTKDKEKAKTYKNVIKFLEKPVSIAEFASIKSLPEISGYFNE